MVHKVIDLIPVVLHTARPGRTRLIYSLTTSLNLWENAHEVKYTTQCWQNDARFNTAALRSAYDPNKIKIETQKSYPVPMELYRMTLQKEWMVD
jgi:hypothetical protein